MVRVDPPIESALIAGLDASAGVISAYLFGSMADNRARLDSDVDVGVLLDRRVYRRAVDRFDARLRLITRLQAAVGREVDVVILNDAPPQLVRHIMTRGRRLMVSDIGLDHACLRTSLSRAADLEPFLRRTRRVKLAALAR